MEPMLLRSYYHSRSHEAHESDNFVPRETMAVDEICADETSSSPEPGFAMNGDFLSFDGNHLMSKVDELSDCWKRGTCAVVKDHIQVLDSHGFEVGRRVELGVEPHDEANFLFVEVIEDVFERRR